MNSFVKCQELGNLLSQKFHIILLFDPLTVTLEINAIHWIYHKGENARQKDIQCDTIYICKY